MRLSIHHATQFEYDVAPSYGLLQVRMVPQSSVAQRVLDWELALTGAREQANFLDQHGNRVDLIEILPEAERVEVRVSGEIETLSDDGILGRHFQPMPLWFYQRQTSLTKPDQAILSLIEPLGEAGSGDIEKLHELSRSILEAVPYAAGETNVSTSAAEALAHGKGVCQDHTHVFLSAARALGFPARYVSGYLMMTDRTDQDASHAWAEVHLEGLGWVGFDVSNGISPDQKYVRVAQGLDYADVAPTKGVMHGGQRENLFVSIQVQQ
ncbi:MAG: transglutaminase family protein [Pseudomonadota bacterium]|nr:transglutaminase family protein [Pseudomonadota bacterium]